MPTTGTRLSVLAMELPRAITPTVAGLAVGAVVGVVGFIAVLLIAGRGSRGGSARRLPPQMVADQVVFIPPYGTLQRDTPLPAAAFVVPQPAPVDPRTRGRAPYHHGPALPFRPSTQLSARAFAKMGYQADVESTGDFAGSDPELFIECELLEEDPDDRGYAKTHAAPTAAVSVSTIVVVEESPAVRAADRTAPHPLGVIPSGSSIMRAASITDLEMDDGATEIGEPYFDEPPQPRRRTDPPKIRAVTPSGPRFPAVAHHLPHPTPPPARALTAARG